MQSLGVGEKQPQSGHPSLESALPYYRGKALVERALGEVGVAYLFMGLADL